MKRFEKLKMESGPPRKKQKKENSENERMILPLINCFMEKTFSYQNKIACLRGISAMMCQVPDILDLLIKKEFMDGIAIIVSLIMSEDRVQERSYHHCTDFE